MFREVRPIVFEKYAAQWLAGLSDLKPSTRRSYRSVVERQLVPALTGRNVNAITAADVNAYLAGTEAGLTPKTRRNVLVLLHERRQH